MKKKIVYFLLPIILIAIVYGFSGDTLEVLARTNTTTTDVTCYVPTTGGAASSGRVTGPTNVWILNLAAGTLYNRNYEDGDTLWYEYTTVTRINTLTEASTPDMIDQTLPSTSPEKTYEGFTGIVCDVLNGTSKGVTVDRYGTVLLGDASITTQTDWIFIDAGPWISFNRPVYESIDKCGKPVVIHYTYKDTEYLTAIPANSKSVDLVNEEGYCGLLNVAKHYGSVNLMAQEDSASSIEKYLSKKVGVKVVWNSTKKCVEKK